MRRKATAVILAGGKSSRMGTDKSMLLVNDRPLIAHIIDQLTDRFDEVLIGTNDTEKYAFTGLQVIPDLQKEKGPLMGIYSCVKASKNEVSFVTACDIPFMNHHFISKMLQMATDVDVVLPVTSDGHFEPLYAIYRKSVVPHAEALLMKNTRKVTELLKMVKVRFIDFGEESWHKNLNTKADYLDFAKNISATD